MANTIDKILGTGIAFSLSALRKSFTVTNLVHKVDVGAFRHRDKITVRDEAAGKVARTTSGHTSPDVTNDINPETTTIELNEDWNSSFEITDAEAVKLIESDEVPTALITAANALSQHLDEDIAKEFAKFPEVIGTAGTTPFNNTLDELADSVEILAENLAPMSERYLVAGSAAYNQLLKQNVLQNVNTSGSSEVIRDGVVSQLFGMQVHQGLNVPRFATQATGSWTTSGAHTTGNTSVTITAGTGTPRGGDLVSFAGNDKVYVVTNATPMNNDFVLTLGKPLENNVTNATALTFTASRVVNAAFQKNALTFIPVPIVLPVQGVGTFQQVTDPETNVTLRAEMKREHNQTRFELRILYGKGSFRPMHGVQIIG